MLFHSPENSSICKMRLNVPTHTVAALFIKYLLSIYLKTGTVLGAEDRLENEKDKVTALIGLSF